MQAMLTLSAEDVDAALTFGGLVEALRESFRRGAVQPVRHHHTIERPDGAPSTLLLMPAWTDFMTAGASAEGYVGVKVVTVSPDNNRIGKPAVMGLYLLLDGTTGEPRALIDGQRLTQWRTAAASALAASYLARKDASRLLIVGAGALSRFLAKAHSAVRPIKSIRIWNRTPANAEKAAADLRAEGLVADAAADLEAEVGMADVISCATISTEPLVKGALLRPGTHVDLVGGFTPQMREADDDVLKRAKIFVDHRQTTTRSGEFLDPYERSVITPADVRGDLFELVQGKVEGRTADTDITMMKNGGGSHLDYYVAKYLMDRHFGREFSTTCSS